jgi:hypothetical protein
MNYLVERKVHLLPEIRQVWGANGYRASGTWPEVFGTSNQADEIFMAWYVGRYVGKVIEAGKAELPLPMYVNAWLGPQPGMDQPGQYPSGGPVARMMDVWRAAAPAADLLAPDIYVENFQGTCALYERSGNPLFIPEARPIVGNLFWALGHHFAVGFSPFGIEDVREGSQLAEAYKLLGNMVPELTKAQAVKKIIGVLLDGDTPQTASLPGYRVKISPSHMRIRLDPGQAPLEPSNTAKAAAAGPSEPPPPETRPYGFVIGMGPDRFLIVGSGILVNFTPESPGPKIAEIGSIEEGRFENGNWIPGRRLNGDEGRPALPSGRIGAIKVTLYRRD